MNAHSGSDEWVLLARALDDCFAHSIEEPSFERALQLLLQSTGSSRAAIGYIDEFGDLLVPFKHGWDDPPTLERCAVGFVPEEWHGAWARALTEAVSCRQLETQQSAGGLVGHSGLATPVIFGHATIGVLYAADKPSEYSAADQSHAELIARRVAPVLSSWLAQRRAQRKLADAGEMAAAAVEGERFFMMSRDLMAIADRKIRRANHAFSHLLGWEPHQLRDKASLADLAHPSDRALLERELELMRTEPNREHPPIIVEMRTRFGESRRIEWVGAATEEGRVYAVGRDVSALSKAVEQLALQNSELQRMHEHARAEELVASRLLANIRRQGCLDAPGIQSIASPLSFFNGDVALAALTPSGELRWMLGDFTGHGLSAAIGTIPIASAFYTACRKSESLTESIALINDQLKGLLPAGLFCAAAFLGLNSAADTLSVWNSALPPILLRRAQDGSVHEFGSQGLPLGLVHSRDLGLEPRSIPVQSGDDVLVFSDGLTEASNARGELFGHERASQALRSVTRPGAGFSAVVRAMSTFRGDASANDDVTLVSVTIGHTEKVSVGAALDQHAQGADGSSD